MPLAHSPSSRILSISASDDATQRARTGRAKRYGGKFASGFLEFYRQSEMADCTVVGPDGREYRLHGLLLAYHSEFFRRALASEFKEGTARRIVLRFEDAGEVWPTLVEYFYTEEITLTDSNVLALFAASRELLIPAIQDYCTDFAQYSLEASNALHFLSQAVRYNCDQFRANCVTLVAQSFNTCCFKPTDGLPVEVMLEILEHPQLNVQTEEQVLLFVLNYVRRHGLDHSTIRSLFSTVRLPFLSNERLAALANESGSGVGCGSSSSSGTSGGCLGPPADMLMAAMAQRLYLLDHPERISGSGSGAAAAPGNGADGRSASGFHSDVSEASCVSADGGGGGGGLTSGESSGTGGSARLLSVLTSLAATAVVPRKSYICTIEYGLPGGSEYVSIPMEQVWDDLASNLTVRVSGDTVEGDADSILCTQQDDTASWFTVTGDDPSRSVWVEVAFPPYMRVVELTKYTFSHGMNMSAHMFPYGISDSSWFQMKGMSTQVSPGCSEDDDTPFISLRTHDSCQQHTEFVVTVDPACTKQVVWRRLRILAAEDNALQVRLSIRRLKLFGRVEVSLLREPEGRDVVAAWRRRKEAASLGRTFNNSALRGLSAKRLEQH